MTLDQRQSPRKAPIPLQHRSAKPTSSTPSYLAGEQITLLVGSSKTKFILSKDLLGTKGGSFFNTATTGDFGEAESGVLSLPDEDPRAFELFVDYLYLDRIPPIPVLTAHRDMTFVPMEEENGMMAHEEPWHRLFRMANKYLLGNLRRLAVDAVSTFHDETSTVCHPKLLMEDHEALCRFDDKSDEVLLAYVDQEMGGGPSMPGQMSMRFLSTT